MSVLQKLTEGLVNRDLQKQGAALMDKWEATGLLEGLGNDQSKTNMARLLENQAAELLREASSMAAGDVEGFASVAFPIVRRVFGGLIANELVSVQPMSLPSGLIFFLDFTYEDSRLGSDGGESVYGGAVVGSQIVSGTTDITEEGGGFYNLANAYSHATGSVTLDISTKVAVGEADFLVSAGTDAQLKKLQFDADINTAHYAVVLTLPAENLRFLNKNQLKAIDCAPVNADSSVQVRRLTTIAEDGDGTQTITFVRTKASAFTDAGADNSYDAGTEILAGNWVISYPLSDKFATGGVIGSVAGTSPWPLEEPKPQTGNAGVPHDGAGGAPGKQEIAEIDIKVDSIAVTAQTKKLKAKWSPELGQDLNAYHNLDAEVELTSVLSEHIALEIDREILNDLVQGAKAGTYYWSRSPGLFVKKDTGAELGATSAAPDFTGTVSEWYETLVETINDVSAQIHRKTLRGGANFLVTSPEVANILEFTSGFRANVTHDSDKGSVGAVNVGSISKKWDVWVDPYFARNLVLVGRRGGSFLESGYVYAPYVPLQVTPTIFGTEDFVPRKGVMTRYAKKMVRPDMYGLVVVRGLLGESGS